MENSVSSYLQNNFKGLALAPPLFYRWPIGVRFEIGAPETGVWSDFENGVLNTHYFENAVRRARSICHAAFSESDDVDVVYEIIGHRRHKIKRKSYVLRQISDSARKNVTFESEKVDGKRGLYRKTAYVTGVTSGEVDYANIFLSIVNTDFPQRSPSLRGRCYFVNRTKDMILHMYDDRGMDVIATDRSALRNVYVRCNDWILEQDKPSIDALFLNESPHP
ncbi:DUF3885 domain-containing protein [Hahella sp. KA22]|uniref:DUF3885 domain-containing protein n=1 Tax=Hahella sp. KA22 TaxID=1628392 RepID=UPI000FDE6AC7|nr:DUF3885 domain-containing protein [Hahella sp. KA22]AZZ94124.1 DUF3885 domain-containing protein [Hahella sp. KA22]QAY57498.1 DUF3885 domain-containing protein [Hahella sp. KA22]